MCLEIEPAGRLATAFHDDGAYCVDDTAWGAVALVTEWEPDGRVANQFERVWGFPIEGAVDTPWGRELERIFR
ncbi:MAG: hypothetical protein KatS3mg108_1194 [Isosphaeraceae bacterium]|nr:MAG: hypothetical protein KatS3mg108_1194 [Isosphaeraceae bacterium]